MGVGVDVAVGVKEAVVEADKGGTVGWADDGR